MPPASFHVSIDIHASPQAVFAYVSDLTKHGEWSANPVQIQPLVSGPVVVGSRYHSHAQLNNLQFETDLVITDYVPPTRFGFSGEDSTGKFQHLFIIQPTPNGTHLERQVSFSLSLRQWLLFLLILYPIRLPAAHKALAALKARLEQP
jgi:Polyketide cyclase / dehydrase and lipid transport